MPEQNGNLAISRLRYNSLKQQQQQQPGESSFRVLYYGGAAGSVPFLWESQPGTPKHTFNDGPLPPLTPPPSYHRLSPQKKNSNQTHKLYYSKLLTSIFQRVNSKKVNAAAAASPMFNSPSSSSSSSSTFSSNSATSTPRNPRRSRSTALRLGFGLENDDDDRFHAADQRSNSPTSTLCFGTPTPRFKGYSYPVKSVKKVVFSIIGGHGTG